MAEVMEKDYATNSKANAALTTGIIGTSLAGLLTLGRGGLGNLLGGWGNNCNGNGYGNGWGNGCGNGFGNGYGYGYGGWGNGFANGFGWGPYPGNGWGFGSGFGYFGLTTTPGSLSNITNQDLYTERKECKDYIDLTKQYYIGKLGTQRELADQFFATYKQNVDSSFGLYQKMVGDTFGLYKNQRDIKDDLESKIDFVDRKVDMMAAVRPYQDALINAKIDNNALLSDYNLSRRTCRMIQGQLVLPNTPVVSGYGSYCCGCQSAPATAA